ncbi:SH3 domain-containing protein [Methyloceanibacter sp. wino2]|uniref:SH3 domain-containing protein n=1 Tax=Methyloceanibacter sp. wino2 TaxID=2170729 RepID=UPI00131F45CD|nr:SH3 domain-containing protein [Methyloceanibacter sp. wino2]
MKRGVTTIKKLLFFTASMSIIALGAVWMMLFNEPIADTMTKAPPPKKRALAYEQALAAKIEEEAEASKTKSQPKAKDAAKSDGGAEKAAAPKDTGGNAPAQPAPDQQAAAVPQPGQDQQAPQQLPWLNEQGESVVEAPGPGAGPNGPPQDFFNAPQQDPNAQGQAYGQNQPYGQSEPYGQQQQPYGQGQPYDRTASVNPNMNGGQDPYGSGGYGGQQQAYPAYPGQAQPGAQGQYPQAQYPQGQYPQQGQPPQGQYPQQQGQYPQGQYPQGQIPPGQYQQGQYPQGQYPQGQSAQGQYPQGQNPQQGQQPGYGADPYAQPQEEWAKIIVSGSGMRLTASEDSPVLFAFPYGRDLKVVSRNGEWVEVTDPNSNAKGWIQAYALGPSAGPQQYGQAGGYYEEQPQQQTRRPLGRGGFADIINRAFGN